MSRYPKKVSSRVKRQQAEKMYVAGKSGYAIAKALEVTPQTVSHWKKKYGWAEKYEEFHKRHLQVLVNDALAGSKEMMDDLGQIRKTSIAPIRANELTPNTYDVAVHSYIEASKLEKELQIASINTAFIQKISQIILKHVQDINILQAIKSDLQALEQEDSKKVLALTGGDAVIEGEFTEENETDG